jgi:hypothetical protein
VITGGGLSGVCRRKQVEKCELHCASLERVNNWLGLLGLMWHEYSC